MTRPQFTINVWAGIIGDLLIGPHDLPPRPPIFILQRKNYLNYWRIRLPLATRQTKKLLHDGASAHFTRYVKQFFGSHYPYRWKRTGSVASAIARFHTFRLLPVEPSEGSFLEKCRHERLTFGILLILLRQQYVWYLSVYLEFLASQG
jgi:hypothetical protein